MTGGAAAASSQTRPSNNGGGRKTSAIGEIDSDDGLHAGRTKSEDRLPDSSANAEKANWAVDPHLFDTEEDTEKPPPSRCKWEGPKALYDSQMVQVGVACLIGFNFLVNIVQAQIDPTGEEHKSAFGVFELAFNLLFLFELILNIWSTVEEEWGCKFWRSGWNVFDFFVVVIGWLFQLSVPLPGPMKLLRMMRAFRVFRLFKRVKSLNKILVALANAVPGVMNAFLIQLIVMCIYAIIAVDRFRDYGEGGTFTNEAGKAIELKTARGQDYGFEYYGDFGKALYTMFQVLTGESWSEAVCRPLFHSDNPATSLGSAFFFVSFVVLNAVVLINVVVAVLLEKMVGPPSGEEVYGYWNHGSIVLGWQIAGPIPGERIKIEDKSLLVRVKEAGLPITNPDKQEETKEIPDKMKVLHRSATGSCVDLVSDFYADEWPPSSEECHVGTLVRFGKPKDKYIIEIVGPVTIYVRMDGTNYIAKLDDGKLHWFNLEELQLLEQELTLPLIHATPFEKLMAMIKLEHEPETKSEWSRIEATAARMLLSLGRMRDKMDAVTGEAVKLEKTINSDTKIIQEQLSALLHHHGIKVESCQPPGVGMGLADAARGDNLNGHRSSPVPPETPDRPDDAAAISPKPIPPEPSGPPAEDPHPLGLSAPPE